MAKATTPTVTMMDTDSLIPYVNNARTHSQVQINQIAASIKEFGFINWRFCKENDCYVVTDCGKVLRVCRRQKSKSGKIISKLETKELRGSLDKYGYTTYRMLVDGVKKHVKGHRLVLNAFVGESTLQANHIDGVKTNNSIENLEWVSALENNQHAVKNGLWKAKKGVNQKLHPSNYVSIHFMIKHLGFKRSVIAQKNNLSRQTIDKVYNIVEDVLSYA